MGDIVVCFGGGRITGGNITQCGQIGGFENKIASRMMQSGSRRNVFRTTFET